MTIGSKKRKFIKMQQQRRIGGGSFVDDSERQMLREGTNQAAERVVGAQQTALARQAAQAGEGIQSEQRFAKAHQALGEAGAKAAATAETQAQRSINELEGQRENQQYQREVQQEAINRQKVQEGMAVYNTIADNLREDAGLLMEMFGSMMGGG